ncbi:DUF6125 family protein [Desulfosporosinus sp. BICA1-9]|uniref:DUF6125 family protein n=1 Tax=Desulfosporosinus sp. BICA1-9 TaxID=1531958 RepID=UPI00054BED2B|nr:DUF6125 family protein [Desulfosporosinus sp. BICA1-9]KJS47308.1 MAG: hypothetical protein VR66_20350 [Peptococcaceae bacterium BRH_c23]KJS86541.1 MAG: hypothetical protein JL57_16160 [Desulfosporosinus sp. BICA1-9]HBW36921.1 hypothetical protein [Desulfosporosinus sp.]
MLNSKEDLTLEQAQTLLEDFAKRWLAHDGLWFQAIEQARGIEEAVERDVEAWRRFTVLEAKRVMAFLGLAENGGLDALERALRFRLYAFLNEQESFRPDDHTLIFHMKDCRVQSARKRKNLPDHPCKPVGEVEYSLFASTIDPRIKTTCIACPPDPHPEEFYCGWKFTLSED